MDCFLPVCLGVSRGHGLCGRSVPSLMSAPSLFYLLGGNQRVASSWEGLSNYSRHQPPTQCENNNSSSILPSLVHCAPFGPAKRHTHTQKHTHTHTQLDSIWFFPLFSGGTEPCHPLLSPRVNQTHLPWTSSCPHARTHTHTHTHIHRGPRR